MPGIQYSVDIKNIGKFEHQNNISINVYAYEDEKIHLLRITTVNTSKHYLNFLYTTAGKTSRYV